MRPATFSALQQTTRANLEACRRDAAAHAAKLRSELLEAERAVVWCDALLSAHAAAAQQVSRPSATTPPQGVLRAV